MGGEGCMETVYFLLNFVGKIKCFSKFNKNTFLHPSLSFFYEFTSMVNLPFYESGNISVSLEF